MATVMAPKLVLNDLTTRRQTITTPTTTPTQVNSPYSRVLFASLLAAPISSDNPA